MVNRLRSWVDSANAPETEFPLNNLPYGVFSTADRSRRLGVAIGDQIVDVRVLAENGFLKALPGVASAMPFLDPTWNAVMALGRPTWDALRAFLIEELQDGAEGPLRDMAGFVLVPMASATLHLPITVVEYTDFYAGRHHATNVGTMFRGADNALPPNWLHMPIGYNGRASSVVVSGSDVRRPWGQVKGPDDTVPRFAPSQRFDFELELGAIVGVPSDGPLTVAEADAAIFGYVLLNDWSARDIQAWEYQPLGPFQAKATATTISPWIVSPAALAPFRRDPPVREVPLLPHLRDCGPMFYDIALSVALTPRDLPTTILCRTNATQLYYSAAQQLAHHSACGCPMRVGDLLGSGTISGPARTERGSLLELGWGGADPVQLTGGQQRSFLEDGDTVALHGAAHGPDYRIGFGPCSGTVLPALADPYTR